MNAPIRTAPAAPLCGIIMGSQSDWPVMRHAWDILQALNVPAEKCIVSAHRTPQRLYDYATTARERGLHVIIAGAGGAAHLPGMVSSMTTLPVLGVPVESRALSGLDSLLSIVQMPAGVPVGTLAIGKAGAVNAGLLAASILVPHVEGLDARLAAWREAQTRAVAMEPEDLE
ncbi:5-(carboxyamino)imidazole ribonucleotide mutase [Phaeovibrio sulfidiphilus]|uniref:N5-carboxyaminoimidazole ribonucleotide mutase n=1 Tax=Phaeovibrio sulfidiphilus TaxID=1220600 RepID=A0A8J7CCZ8_9PROT|nr:5-(carboxyamino)imidazole ribonucleotide mutase [Phaeovibrio sulfidiphilus]MBE1236454.1 5-(carboxyamino)imidazole ribonucleotide mutase [Phaeovibrio sulfidiphilus]